MLKSLILLSSSRLVGKFTGYHTQYRSLCPYSSRPIENLPVHKDLARLMKGVEVFDEANHKMVFVFSDESSCLIPSSFNGTETRVKEWIDLKLWNSLFLF